jgi:hypothetical protein
MWLWRFCRLRLSGETGFEVALPLERGPDPIFGEALLLDCFELRGDGLDAECVGFTVGRAGAQFAQAAWLWLGRHLLLSMDLGQPSLGIEAASPEVVLRH